ncbi:TetR/AcrR family transcriptional regulator [Sphingorhabdus sp. Alg231-15]|uniref:TetR/AcrR family transcriptional regulator n=1 Tax=Sphingorhabdus sp. Alg231-15 TaxID=1922222 RepID=UPI000D5551C9
MAKQTTSKKMQTEHEKPHPDGRRQRSQASRAKIVKAFMELIESGDPSPSAARVAKRAGVGLRSVFRHFDDMDSLYAEIDGILNAKWGSFLTAPYKSGDWQEQLIELIARRAKVNEATYTHRIMTSIARFRSELLMSNYKRLLKFEKDSLNRILPKFVQKDKQRSHAILLATSFDSWRLFRQDEGLSNKRVIATMSQMVSDLAAQIDD